MSHRPQPTAEQLSRSQGTTAGTITAPGVGAEIERYIKTYKSPGRGRNGRPLLGDCFPILIAEYVHPDDRERAKELTCQSTVELRFHKNCGHDYFTTSIVKFIQTGAGRTLSCPECDKNLNTQRSLGFSVPDLLDEWDTKRNEGIDPFEIRASSGEKVWWIHRYGCGKPWETSVRTRVYNQSGCTTCRRPSSRQALIIFCELEALGYAPQREEKLVTDRHYQADISLAHGLRKRIVVEYDGWPHHKGREVQDAQKTDVLLKVVDKVIRVRHAPLTRLQNDDIIHRSNEDLLIVVQQLVRKLLPWTEQADILAKATQYLERNTLIAPLAATKLLLQLERPSASEKSLREVSQKAADDFDRAYDLNGVLAVEVRQNCSREGHFVCGKCKERYEKTLREAGNAKEPCPVCSNRKIVKEVNHLSKTHPNFYAEILVATQKGHNKDIDHNKVHQGATTRVDYCCSSCNKLNEQSDVREVCRGKAKCPCKSFSAEFLTDCDLKIQALYAGDVPIAEVKRGSKKEFPWMCSGTLPGYPQSPNCTGMATEARSPKTVVGRLKNGSLPTCDCCRALRLPQNQHGYKKKGSQHRA